LRKSGILKAKTKKGRLRPGITLSRDCTSKVLMHLAAGWNDAAFGLKLHGTPKAWNYGSSQVASTVV